MTLGRLEWRRLAFPIAILAVLSVSSRGAPEAPSDSAGSIPGRWTPPPGAPPFPPELVRKIQSALLRKGPAYHPRTRLLEADGSPRYTNRLILEASPYLIQHAHNPVSWYPWGDEAFRAARNLGRPIFLSVGYSTCHWCHVMEEESFEDAEIARYLNENYVAIKVDREERPDVDSVYMSAIQTLTGGGGWPMNVWLTPDRKPFFGGTYFPARDGDRGIPTGLLSLLRQMKERYGRRRPEIDSAAEDLARAVRTDLVPPPPSGLPGTEVLLAATRTYRDHFDSKSGGLAGAPKFPSGFPIRFLLRIQRRTGDADLARMATLTLEKMAAGGIRDQVGGGFHRYATDSAWRVPHFEKMLYDNALLATTYLEGYQAAGREEFARVSREILGYVEREMTSPEGAFYAATDADSPGTDGRPEEGRYFTWTLSEIETVLGPKDSPLVIAYYGVTGGGNHAGRNVLFQAASLEETAKRLGISPATARDRLARSRDLLYSARSQRHPPHRDEKLVCAWNGLMISAFARAALVFGEESYASRAERAADFFLSRRSKEGRLLRSYPGGPTPAAANLSDYAFLCAGLLDLYEATGNPLRLRQAMELDAVLQEDFEDGDRGGFFLTGKEEEQLIAREKPAYDGAEPSGNSVAVMNLLRLHELSTEDRYRVRAERALKAFGGLLASSPAALSEMLLAAEFRLDHPKEIILVAPRRRAEAAPFLRELGKIFLPNRILMVAVAGEDLEGQAALAPLLEGKTARGGKVTAYVCEERICQLPTDDLRVFGAQIRKISPLAGAPETS